MSALSSLLLEIDSALRSQDWSHALDLVSAARETQTPDAAAERHLLLAEADALRGIGSPLSAQTIYRDLASEDSPQLLRAMHGLASCYLDAGAIKQALELSERVCGAAGKDHTLRLRGEILLARARSRGDIRGALTELSAAMARPHPAGSARAHGRLILGSLHGLSGDYAAARRQIGIARAEAEAADATKTLADCLCAEARLAMLEGDAAELAAASSRLAQAERLYRGLGDRGVVSAHLTRGQVYRHLGQTRMAQRELQRASWAANEVHDQLTHAHSLLELAELSRASSDSDPEALSRALAIYRRAGDVRGEFYCQILIGLGAREGGRLEVATRGFTQVRDHLARHSSSFADPDHRLLEDISGGITRSIVFHFPL